MKRAEDIKLNNRFFLDSSKNESFYETSGQHFKRVLIIGGSGYIGTALAWYLSQKGYDVGCVDTHWSPQTDLNLGYSLGQKTDYRELNVDDLKPYDALVHLAGHSNVKMSQEDPDGAFENNLVGFYYLTKKLKSQKFIYASSSSIYNGSGSIPATEDWEHFQSVNMYDYTKFSIDRLMEFSDLEYYGLRFGTVNGPSPRIREDLMLNCMVKSALEKRQIDIYNPHINRPVLAITDLCRSIESIIAGGDQRGFYNLASFNATVLSMGSYIADLMQVPLYIYEGKTTYDFTISTQKFQTHYNFQFESYLEDIVDSLIKHYTSSGTLRNIA